MAARVTYRETTVAANGREDKREAIGTNFRISIDQHTHACLRFTDLEEGLRRRVLVNSIDAIDASATVAASVGAPRDVGFAYDWERAIHAANHDRDRLEALRKDLASVCASLQSSPPYAKPPDAAQESVAPQDSPSPRLPDVSQQRPDGPANSFALLRDSAAGGVGSDGADSDESSSDDDDCSSVVSQEVIDHEGIPVEPYKYQVRYFRVRCSCGIAETLVMETRPLRQARRWLDMADALQRAYECLRRILIGMDGWQAALAEAADRPGPLFERHCRPALDQLFANVNLVRDFVTAERDTALDVAERRLRALEDRRRQRDEIRARMGSRWTENPAPQTDNRTLLHELSQLRDTIPALRDMSLPGRQS